MELSPKTYRHIVRPRWFSNYLFHNTIGRNFDFINKDVLDFGCGIGTYCKMFHPKNYVGMDKNRDRIRYAKKIHPKYSFIQLNGNTLSLPDHSIDYIIVISVLHHISTPIINDYFKEFKRILKKEGKVIVVEPCKLTKTSICNWMMQHCDRGKFIRKEFEYLNLFEQAKYHTKVVKKYKQLFFYNKIFITAKPLKLAK